VLKTHLIKSLATCGLASGLIAGSASGAVVFTDTDFLDNPSELGNTELFAFGGYGAGGAAALSDGNTFATFTAGAQNAGGGTSSHVGADLFGSVSDGTVIRFSAWSVSSPLDPWQGVTAPGEILKIEFYAEPLGAAADRILDTDIDLGIQPELVVGESDWALSSFEFTIDENLVPPSLLQEIRPVMFTGDFSGAGPTTGTMFVDNIMVEIFAAQAEADATPLNNPKPGGFDPIDPDELLGDLNGDGFVGAGDLDILLGNWNNGIPPQAGGVTTPEPASLALLGLGGLVALRRRR